MYEVIFKDGKEQVLSGTPREIRRYNRAMWLWTHRWLLYWVWLLFQISPMILLADIATTTTEKLICGYAIFAVFFVHTANWLCGRWFYPYVPPLLIGLKRKLLIRGKMIGVRTWETDKNAEPERLQFGCYQHFDPESELHMVVINGENKYVKFHQLMPVRY